MPESQNIEYKESWRDEFLKWICGFANAQGGKIFIGINDQGQVNGLKDYKKLLEDIPNKVVMHLGVVVDVNLHQEDSNYYLEINVPPSSVPISYHGSYHFRSGSTKQELKGSALQQFLLKKIGRTWDDLPLPQASPAELNPETISRFIHLATRGNRLAPDASQADVTTLLENLHLYNEDGQLKFAAVLLFGLNPLKFFSTAYLKIGRFEKSDADLRFQDVVTGNLLDMPDKVLDVLRSKYLTSPITYQGINRVETLEYPEEALREALLNAIVHKDYAGTQIQLSVYDDRLILWNPGRLPDELNIQMLKGKHPSRPRNKNIAEVFFKAGFIEAWGRGIAKILLSCQQAGIPEPIIEEYAGGIQITFLKDIYTAEYLQQLNLDERLIKALLYVKAQKSITNAQYQKLLEVSKRTASSDLQELTEKGFLIKTGTRGPSTSYRLNFRNGQ